MNREIKFRAIRTDNREFVKGNYVKTIIGNYDSETHQILPFGENVISVFVDVSTLGQFTGLRDKKRAEVYEGDIDKSRNVILWDNRLCLFCLHYYNEYLKKWTPSSYPIESDRLEIVGNIHENPELLNNK